VSVEAISWAWAAKVGDQAAKLVLTKLADNANYRGECFPSQEYLARTCEMSVRTVQRKVQFLVDHGLLLKRHRYDGDGKRMSDIYRLPVNLSPSPPRLHDTAVSPKPSEERSSASPPPSRAASTKTRPPDPTWDALLVACDAVGRALTKDERGRFNAAVKQLKAVDATPEEIIQAGRRVHRLWPNLPVVTPQTLTGNWHLLTRQRVNGPAPPAPEPDPEPMTPEQYAERIQELRAAVFKTVKK
jgi:helix-turn-helix protein